MKEAYLSGYTPATFILAPMAMALREQGMPIKIVYQLLQTTVSLAIEALAV